MAKKRTGLDALREYEARSGRQTQSGNQQTGNAGSSGGTWRSGLDALREYEASGGGQNVTNGPYNPDYRTNTRKATPQSYEAAYQQYKQYVAEYQKQTEFPRRVSVGTAAQQAGGSQKRDYSRMLGLNQLDGDMQPRVQAAQDIQKYLQFQRKVQTGTAAQQAATNAGQDYSRLIGLNQFDGELERRAAEWQRKQQAAQGAAALDQERGRRRTSEEYGKRIDALEAASDYARAQNAEGGGMPEFKDAYDKVNAGRETPMTLDEMQKELAYTRYKKAVLDKSVSGRVGEYAGDLATQFISGGADMALGGLGMVLGYLEQGANGAAAWTLRDLAKAVPDGSIKDKMLSLADDFSSYYTGESMTAGEETARYYRDELNRIGDEIEGKYKGVALWIQQQMPSAGNMLFGAGLSGIAGVNNLVTLGLTSGGNSALEAKDKGASDAQALAYGVVAGGLEVFSEKLFGGNPIYDTDAGLVNKAVGKLTDNKTIMKILNSKAFDIASEGLEEVVTEVLDPVAEWAIYNGDNTEFADAASIGNAFLGGVFLSAIGNVADAPKQLQQARYERVLRTAGSELADIAQSVDSADVQEAAQVIRDKIAYGVTPDAADIGAVLDAMDQAGETVDVEQVREAVDAEENEAKAAQAEADFQTYNQYADERDARQEAREAPQQASVQAVQEAERRQEPTLPGTKQAEQTATQEEAPVQEANKKGEVRLEEQQENVVPDGGSRRESGQRAGKPFGTVAGRTEKTNAAAQQSRTAVERQNRARDLRLPKVSTVELGVSRGTGYRGNTVFMRENWDAGMKETAARVKQRTGIETTYVLGPLQVRKSNGGTARAAAVFTGDRIIVQADNLRATIDQLAAHETYHWIADNTPGLNAQIEQNIRDTFSEEEFDQIVETYIRSRRGVNDVPAEGTDAEFDEALNAIKEEIYADAYAGINAFGTHAEQYQQTVREAAELRTTAQTAEKTGGPRVPPEKYSIGKATDNKPFVEVEQDILAGVPEADWVKTVKENLKKKFPNGITVGNNEINIDYQSRQEMTFSRYMQWLYNNDPQLRADKLRATDNADEILRATTDWVNEGLNHPRKDKIADFARGNVLLRVGGNGYTAEVVVGTRESGSMLLYDILNLQPTSFTEKETDAAKAENPSPGTNRNTASVSEPSIRRTEQKSQEKFSVTEAADGQEDKRRSERVNLPTIAQRELKSTLFKMFSVSKTQRTDVGRVIDYFADRIYTNGELTQTDRDVFLARLYSSGAMMESLRQQPDAVPDIVGDGRLYVSERARREFGSEWNDFRKRAFEAGIYLTDSTADRSAEAWTQALSEAAPDTFSETGGSQRQKLEQIVQAAEEAQDQNLSLSEYAQALAGKDFVSDDTILENMERQLDWAMRTFAEKAKLEVKLRGDKTAAIEAERDRSAQRNAQRLQNNAGVIVAMDARTDERLQKKDAATARSRQKLIEAMEARTDERLQKKDAALAKSKEKLIDAMEARIDERIQREKAREANRRALERQDRKDMAARQKARRELQELQKKTLKTLQWLNKNRFRAPEELREQFDEVLSDIDLYAVGTANEMQWSGKYNATWRDLAQMYQDAKANDPNFLPSKELERIVTRLDARKIGDMDLDALGKLYQAAVELRTEFANRNRVLGDAEERIFEDVYADSVREINSAAGGYTGKLSDRFMNMEQLSTMNVLERMAGWNPNSTWYGMAKQLEKGERDAQSYKVAAAQILQDFMQKNREWVMRSDGQGKDAIWYEIKVPELLELGMGDKPIFGKTVTVYMTPAQKVHMYLESRNYDNLRHMAGGRTFANRELYSKGKRQEAFAQGTTIKLAPETVKAIVSDLTVEEKALADVLDRYYNGYAKSEINRVSNILYGYDKAMGKNYAPIFTNSSFTKSEPGIYDATAEGVGNLKTRQVSKNPTYNIGAYDAFERNVSQTSRFVGMAIPARNWKTLLNWRGSTTSMKTVIDGKWGEVTEKYIMDQLTKLEAGGSSEQDFVTTAADKVFSNYIAATFGFNPSIVLKQAGSIPLAAAYLGAENTPSPKQIAQIDRTLISKYTKMLDYRLMGYATPETKQLKDHPTKIQNNKVLNFTFGGGAITAMDGWAASTLWPWAENAVRRENPELEIGTQEQIDAGQSPFYQKVAERFNDAVARSQSTSDEMHQGRLRKSKNALAKALTMFRSDSAQVYNTVRQAIGEAQYYKRSGASIEVQRRANRRVGQAFVSAAGGYIWSTAVTFLMALLKHRDKKYRDDDGNLTALSVLKGMGEDLLSSIAGAASIGGEEVVELIGGTLSGERFYDIFNSQSVEQLNKVLELIDTHGKNINKFVTDGADLIKNKGDLTLYLKRYGNDMLGDIRNLAKEIATYGFSLPANNLETYILGTVKTVSPALGTAYDDAMQTANRNLLKGLTGDALRMRVQHVFQVRDVDVSSEAVQAVARLYEAGYTNAAPADTPSSLNIHDEKRELKAYQKQTYDMVWSEAVRNSLNELVQSDEFQSAGDDQQAKMLAKLYDYAEEQAKGVLFDDYEADAYVEKFKKLADNGVPESASIAYSVMAANVEGEKDADGKTISGSKRDEAMGILDGMELTGSQKSALLAANYSATGFEPWSGYREALKAGGDTWDAFYQNAVSAKVADGKTQEDAEKAVKSALKSQLKEDYLGGSMPEREVSDYLQKYCGAEDEHDVYWTLEEWKGGEGWKKYGQFLDAVDKGVLADTRKVAKEYMKHGVDKGDLSSQLTKHFKEAWLAATGDEATRLKNAYISAYKAIGGDADKARDNIIKWRREANKRKGDKK
jgi:hypothetical protein